MKDRLRQPSNLWQGSMLCSDGLECHAANRTREEKLTDSSDRSLSSDAGQTSSGLQFGVLALGGDKENVTSEPHHSGKPSGSMKPMMCAEMPWLLKEICKEFKKFLAW